MKQTNELRMVTKEIAFEGTTIPTDTFVEVLNYTLYGIAVVSYKDTLVNIDVKYLK